MSHVYVGSEGRHTICLSSLEIGCIIDSIDESIRMLPAGFPKHLDAMIALHEKMTRYYELVIGLERKDQEEDE